MKVLCIDFETANMWKNSICQAGIAVIDNGVITETKSWLINPDSFFDDFNIRIHGITKEMVKDKPLFKEIWSEINEYIDNTDLLFAHNARFDVAAISDSVCQIFDRNFPFPAFNYFCTLAMARRAFPGEASYSLQSLCKKIDIEYGNHDACADALSCANLVLKIFETQGIDPCMPIQCEDDVSILEDKLQVYVGMLCEEGIYSSVCKHLRKPNVKNIVGNIEKNDPDSFFYQKKVAFTGALSSMTRNEAMQRIADIGGYPEKGITTNTNILVVGQQDFRIVGESGMSSKQKKAIEMKEKGLDIEIIPEKDFLQNL
ncbi:3'-5' exoribonuclease [Bacteroidales bacterium OttesenSCG-928-I21]|nr:3'-5' exoribonuclease [Bacteroidales bacterium OttesenSCG-928-I21]